MNPHDETSPPGDPSAERAAPDTATSLRAQEPIDRAQRFVVAVTALLAAGANLLIFVEKQWSVAAVTVLLGALGAAFYVAARKRRKPSLEETFFTRVAARAVLVTVALITIAAALFVTVSPRLYERGTIFAVARFIGPPLPAPYGDCRPSDRLAQTLADVGHDYQNVSAFELPYSIDPGGRWAGMSARWHGFLQGADTVIYGEYSFVDDGMGSKEPDRLLITPQTDSVPAIPLGNKTAPLMNWRFPNRLVRIDDLCTGRSQRFLNDGRRLILALAGLQMFASQRYVAAERALGEAKSTSLGETGPDSKLVDADRNSLCDTPGGVYSECSGELAFYLAVLDKHFGRVEDATREFAFAARHLMRPAPYIDLGEMYVARNDGRNALTAFEKAVATDPTSIAAWASLSQCRREYGDSADLPAAKLELDRARSLAQRQGVSSADSYGIIALSRALFQRNDGTDRHEAVDWLRRLMERQDFDSAQMTDTIVDFAKWQIALGNDDVAVHELERALKLDPDDIRANFYLATQLRKLGPQNEREARNADVAAMFGHAYTDEQYTTAGNAAAALGRTQVALEDYNMAISRNAAYAYAYASRADLLRGMGKRFLAQAIRDYRAAVALHPHELELTSGLQATLKEAHRQADGGRVAVERGEAARQR